MPTLAGWLTGEQVPREVIEQTLTAMGELLGRHGGQAARAIQPGAGLIAFSDTAYVMQRNDDPPVLDWVPDRRTFVYRRPLTGLHTLYYIVDWPAQGNLLFASELKALFAVGVPRKLHLPALSALQRYGFIPAPWTLFKDIQVVPAGSILRWQRAKTVLNHSTDYHLDEPLTDATDYEQIRTLLDEASAGLLPPHEQLVALTGGGSASALASMQAAQHTTAPFPLATLGTTTDADANEWEPVQAIAQACERPLLAITSVDQPEFWTATLAGLETPCVEPRSLALHQLLHTVATETQARVAISGLGANLLLGQSLEQLLQAAPAPDTQNMAALSRYLQLLQGQSTTLATELWSTEVSRELAQAESWTETLHARKLARQAAQFTDPRQGLYYLDLHLRLPDLLVQPAEQLATQEHIVLRSPYLNTRVVDRLTRLPAILDDGTPRTHLLTKLIHDPLLHRAETTTKLPLTTPTASLLQLEHSDLLKQVLTPEAIKERGIFAPQAVAALLKQAPDQPISRELLLVFTTQLLCQLFNIEGW